MESKIILFKLTWPMAKFYFFWDYIFRGKSELSVEFAYEFFFRSSNWVVMENHHENIPCCGAFPPKSC